MAMQEEDEKEPDRVQRYHRNHHHRHHIRRQRHCNGRPSRPLLGLRRVRLSSHLARCPSPAQQSNHAAAADDAECRERYFGDDEMYRLICYTCR